MTTRRFAPAVCVALFMGPLGLLQAAELPDPTRPPFAVMAPKAAGPAQAGQWSGQATGEPSKARAEARTPPARNARLSAVMLADAPGRSTAVVDGRIVGVGDRVDGGSVLAITANTVLIQQGKQQSRLTLYDRDPEPDGPTTGSAPSQSAAPASASASSASSPSGARSAPDKDQP